MAEWSRAPANPPREVGGAGSSPGQVIDSFFDLFFHIVSWYEFLTTTSLKIQMARSICLCLLNNASIFPNFELTL